VDAKALAFAPKAIVLATKLWVVAGNVAVDPEGTEVASILVTVFLDVI
jgi:hypothetical protein